MHILRSALALLTALVLVAPDPLAGQEFPGFGSLAGRVGAIFPDDGDPGLSASAEVGLGYLGTPLLRTVAGFHYFTADVENRRGTQVLSGSLTGIGGHAGLRLDLLGAARLSPYLSGTLVVASIDREADVEAQQSDFENVYARVLVGAGLGAGLAYALDEAQRFAVTAEGRRVFASDANLSYWVAEAGLRITPRGRQAYDRVIRYRDPFFRDEARMTAAERERVRAERERLEAERLRTERERQETERQRIERERAEAERARAEQERLARMTDEERERARLEAERLRVQADTLAAAARREAEARAAAEREAERLRAEREAAETAARQAEAAAREAEIRAAAAEQRLYSALLDLDRLIANITEIRETERGLVVVLGQGLFATGQSALSARARDEVRQIATVLTQFPEQRILVEGHTDAVGSEVANQRLSEQRAEAVRAALIAEGIDPGRVEMVGYGESQPVADNATAEGRAQNRRVEIVILGARRPAAMQ